MKFLTIIKFIFLLGITLVDVSMQQPPGGTGMGGAGVTTTTVTNYNYVSSSLSASSDPVITSWIKSTGYSSSWKAYTNVNKIQYSSKYVYISASGIPSYSIGPWPGNPGNASNQNWVIQLPRIPVPNTGTATTVSLNSNGILVNGVPFFNPLDGQNIMGWNRNAYYYEGSGFDSCNGHPQSSGSYHNHVFPACLYNASDSSKHSAIVGYAFDGYPVYGPWGYSNATNSNSAIRRIQSSYQLRSITSRTTLANGSSVTGPTVNTTYPLGAFVDDYQYTAGSGDLDSSNGRYCVTPEYPGGTYAYFMTTSNSTGLASYPYILGLTYYGVVIGNDISSGQVSITETVETYYTASSGKIQTNLFIIVSLIVYSFF